MNTLEVNKFVGGGLTALLVAMVAGFIGNAAVAPHLLHENAYPIEIKSESAAVAAAPAALEPIGRLLAAANAETGKTLSRQCASCHTFDKGGRQGVGPNLWDVLGGAKAHVAGFAYSNTLEAMSKRPGDDGRWGYEQLNAFLASPRTYVPGTKMSFAGLRRAEDRAALIASLRSLSDAPKPLP